LEPKSTSKRQPKQLNSKDNSQAVNKQVRRERVQRCLQVEDQNQKIKVQAKKK
jgi:hypothetical protein